MIENGQLPSKKVALVTGGSRGIGKAIALTLANAGVGIVLTYKSNKTEGDRVAEEIEASGGVALALQLDVATTSSFDTFLDQLKALLLERFGTEKIDFLINNGGFGKAIPISLWSLSLKSYSLLVLLQKRSILWITNMRSLLTSQRFFTGAACNRAVAGAVDRIAPSVAVAAVTEMTQGHCRTLFWGVMPAYT